MVILVIYQTLFDSVVVDVAVGSGRLIRFTVNAFPRTGLKYCTNWPQRRAEFCYDRNENKRKFPFIDHFNQFIEPSGKLTVIKLPNIFEIFVTIENELPNNSSGISSITISRSKSGVSSVTPGGKTGVARVTLSCNRRLSSLKSPFLESKIQKLESFVCKMRSFSFTPNTECRDRKVSWGRLSWMY